MFSCPFGRSSRTGAASPLGDPLGTKYDDRYQTTAGEPVKVIAIKDRPDTAWDFRRSAGKSEPGK
jgi:hypothetical protein